MKTNLKKIVNIFKMVHNSSKGYISNIVFLYIFKSILPFIEIIFSYLILDALIFQYEKELIYQYVIAMICLNLIVGLVIHILSYRRQIKAIKLTYDVENNIALKNFVLDYEQVEDNEVQGLIQKAQDGSNSNGGIEAYFDVTIGSFMASLLTIIYALIILTGLVIPKNITGLNTLGKFLNNPFSILVLVLSLILSCIIGLIIMKADNKKSYEAMIKNVDLNRKFSYMANLSVNYKYGKDIRVFGMKNMLMEQMSSSKWSVNFAWREYSLFNIKISTIGIFLSKVLSFIAYAYVGLKAIYGLITIGNVVSYVASIVLLSGAVNTMISAFTTVSLMNSYLDNYFLFLDLKSNMKYGAQELSHDDEIEIEFKDVSFKYPHQNEYILKHVNLKILKGQKLALVGQNGAGKTTLIKLLCRLYNPTEGEILINNIPIQNYTKKSCYDLFSVVFQDFKLFSYSIRHNITGGEEGNTDKIISCLDKAGVMNRINKMEKGIDTILYSEGSEQGVEVSGGEAQKIAIARALYKDSPIVVLDEPTAALDPKSEAEIYEKFQTLVNHKTSIFISHRMSSCKFCDEIIVMENGQIVQKGSHHDLLNNENGLYLKMWTAQAKYYND